MFWRGIPLAHLVDVPHVTRVRLLAELERDNRDAALRVTRYVPRSWTWSEIHQHRQLWDDPQLDEVCSGRRCKDPVHQRRSHTA